MQNNQIKLKSLIKPQSKYAFLSEVKQRLMEQDPVDPESEKEMEKVFTDAMNKAMTDFKAAASDAEKKTDDEKAVEDALKKTPELEKIATEGLRRRNVAIVEGNLKEQQLNEIGVLFAVSLAIAIPRIVELIGKAVKFLSIAMGGKGLIGAKLEKAGHKWHDKIIKMVMKGLTLIPGYKELPTDKQEKIAKIVHTVIVASLAISSGVGAIEAAKEGSTILSGIEAALTAVKAGEVGVTKFLSSAISKILG